MHPAKIKMHDNGNDMYLNEPFQTWIPLRPCEEIHEPNWSNEDQTGKPGRKMTNCCLLACVLKTTIHQVTLSVEFSPKNEQNGSSKNEPSWVRALSNQQWPLQTKKYTSDVVRDEQGYLTRKRNLARPYRRRLPRVLGGSWGVGRFLMGEVPL